MFVRGVTFASCGLVAIAGLAGCADTGTPAVESSLNPETGGVVEPVETDQVSISLEEIEGAETGSVVLGDVALMVVNVDLDALQNTGARIDSIAVATSDGAFSVDEDTCTGVELVPGSPCEVTIEAIPQATGTYTVTLEVILEAGGDPVEQTFEIEVVEPDNGGTTDPPIDTGDPATPKQSDHPDEGGIVE
jgi:hypothetical protein